MKLIDFCIRYPVSVLVGVILLILFGFIAMFRIPVQMIPTVDRPEISVETEYRGAAPAEIEREITERIEEKLNSVEALSEITSTSVEGKSTVRLTFDWGANKDIARLDVSEKRGLVRDIPGRCRRIGHSRLQYRSGTAHCLDWLESTEASGRPGPRVERGPGRGGRCD